MPDYRFHCHVCNTDVDGIRPRPWPGLGVLVDCPNCGNSQTVPDPHADTEPAPPPDEPTDPDCAELCDWLRGSVSAFDWRRDQR